MFPYSGSRRRVREMSPADRGAKRIHRSGRREWYASKRASAAGHRIRAAEASDSLSQPGLSSDPSEDFRELSRHRPEDHRIRTCEYPEFLRRFVFRQRPAMSSARTTAGIGSEYSPTDRRPPAGTLSSSAIRRRLQDERARNSSDADSSAKT